MPEILIVNAKVATKAIRRETVNNEECFVVSSFTLPGGVVMNGVLYPQDEIDKHYLSLDGTLAPLGHPMADGQHISAKSPLAINSNHIGAYNRNPRKVGNRIHVEKVINLRVAANSADGKALIQRLEAHEAYLADPKGKTAPAPIHTSVAAFIERTPAVNQSYKEVAKIIEVDHDAILLHEPGAATPAQGVGLMVNAEQAVALTVNAEGLLGDDSYRNREARLEAAVKARFLPGEDDWAWVRDFDDKTVLVSRRTGDMAFEYTQENGVIRLADEGVAAVRTEVWVEKMKDFATNLLNRVKSMGTNSQSQLPTKDDETMTDDDRKAIVAAIKESMPEMIANAVKPLTEKVDALTVNHDKLAQSMQATERAQEAEMRKAVAAAIGDLAANDLKGEALVDVHRRLGKSPTLAPNSAGGGSDALAALDNAPD